MPIKAICSCGAKFNAREELAGKSIECTACGRRMQVPHAMAAAAGGGSSAVLMSLVVGLAVAVAAGGYMIFTQQARLTSLQQQLEGERTRVDDVQDELVANKTADAAVSVEVEKEKERLTAESKKHEELLESLDKLDMEAVRIRGDIAKVEEDRRRLTADSETKSVEIDGHLEELRAVLATKPSAADTALINKEIRAIQGAKRELQTQTAANRAKLDGFDNNVRRLQDDLRTKLNAQRKLSDQVVAADKKLAALEKRANPATLKNQIATLSGDAQSRRAPVFKTVSGQGRVRGSGWFRIDTRTGRVSYRCGPARGVVAAAPNLGYGQNTQAGSKTPGRYELELTLDGRGNLRELVRLDTELGRVSYADLRNPWNLRWAEVTVMTPGWVRKDKINPRWSMSVQRSRPSAGTWRGPMLVVTAPNGLVYDDSRSYRTWLLPNP